MSDLASFVAQPQYLNPDTTSFSSSVVVYTSYLPSGMYLAIFIFFFLFFFLFSILLSCFNFFVFFLFCFVLFCFVLFCFVLFCYCYCYCYCCLMFFFDDSSYCSSVIITDAAAVSKTFNNTACVTVAKSTVHI